MSTRSFLFNLAILFLVFSCNGDDQFVRSTDYALDIDLDSRNAFIVVTNQDQEVLYSTYGENLNETIEFEVGEEDIIDFTYGYERGSDFRIFTYRNISPEFTIQDENKPVENAAIELRANRTLEINGLIGEVINNPLRETTIENDRVLLSGFTSDKSKIFTVYDR